MFYWLNLLDSGLLDVVHTCAEYDTIIQYGIILFVELFKLVLTI